MKQLFFSVHFKHANVYSLRGISKRSGIIHFNLQEGTPVSDSYDPIICERV